MSNSPQGGPTTLPTSISELILPFQPSLGQTLTSLKQSRLSIRNRLLSILSDSSFVSTVSECNNLPLIANERCGSWYVPADLKAGSVYFKSTDGHQGQWAFSQRRLNLPLLEVLGKHGGAVIVDSTRRGKSMPDGLSKTVSIWAAVVNRVLFPDDEEFHALITPEDVVGRSEHVQIERRLDGFVQDFKALDLDVARLKTLLGKPIRMEFISRQTTILKVQRSTKYHTLICCSASRHEVGDGDQYVQGAGDDTENWAHGLTAELFWRHKDRILAETNEMLLQELIEQLVDSAGIEYTGSVSQIWLGDSPTSIFLCQSQTAQTQSDSSFAAYISCEGTAPDFNPAAAKQKQKQSTRILHLGCVAGKLGGKALRDKLPQVDKLMTDLPKTSPSPRILISCSSGKDLSAGIALALLCRYVDGSGRFLHGPKENVTKSFIRQRLACIVASCPGVNPSRATLQSVNTFLMQHVE